MAEGTTNELLNLRALCTYCEKNDCTEYVDKISLERSADATDYTVSVSNIDTGVYGVQYLHAWLELHVLPQLK